MAHDGAGNYRIEYNTTYIRNGPITRTVFVHEMGHIMDNYFFFGQGYNKLLPYMKKSPKFQKCFKANYVRGCVPDNELFAEQFAFYATGYDPARDQRISGYSVPKLISGKDMHNELAKAYKENTASF